MAEENPDMRVEGHIAFVHRGSAESLISAWESWILGLSQQDYHYAYPELRLHRLKVPSRQYPDSHYMGYRIALSWRIYLDPDAERYLSLWNQLIDHLEEHVKPMSDVNSTNQTAE